MDRLPDDTHPEAAQVQLDLVRQATVARRFELTRSLTRTAIEMSRHAIQVQHPDWSELEVKLEWVALAYGRDLADRVRAYLAARHV